MLPNKVRQVLAELELVSHGATQAWNPAGHVTGEHVMPPGELAPPHITFRTAYLKATTDIGRRTVLADAKNELRRWRGHGIDRSRVQAESQDSVDARMLRDGAGETPERVATAFRCTPTRVRRLRIAAGLNAEAGRAPKAPSSDAGSEALRLRENGMSIRAIALALGLPKSTVHDLLAA